MGWPNIADEIESCKLSGQLAGDNMVLTPADKTLKQYEFQLGIGEVTDFEIARVKDDDKESTRTELRFKIRTASGSAAAQLYDYLSKVGKAPAAMKLKYSEQGSLTDQPETSESAADEAPEEQPPLDNLMNMVGSGRKRKQRTRGEMSASVQVEDADEAAQRDAVAKQIADQVDVH